MGSNSTLSTQVSDKTVEPLVSPYAFANYMSVFYGGYVLGQIPNNLALQKLPPRVYFPSCVVGWGVLTLGTAFCHYPWQIMVIRFFQAAIESSTFVGCHYILGSWYKQEELGKRTAIFTSSGLAGTLFSGFLQGGIYSSLSRSNLESYLFSPLLILLRRPSGAPRMEMALHH